MALLMLRANGTVGCCHSHTQNLAEMTRQADILVVAAGSPRLITGDMVKPGVVVIDVAMNRDPETGKFFGDKRVHRSKDDFFGNAFGGESVRFVFLGKADEMEKNSGCGKQQVKKQKKIDEA